MTVFRFDDDTMRKILSGCATDDEWWVWHPRFPVQVSNLGHIRGVRGWVLKPYLHNGYPAVDICGRRHLRVHSLVLESFVGDRPDGEECRHWDGDRENLRLDNLFWGTRLENAADRWRDHRLRQSVHEQRKQAVVRRVLAGRPRTRVDRQLALLDKYAMLA